MSGPALLNIDAGEHEDEPEELYALAQIVNIACGGHAGDDASMTRVIAACAREGTRVGAHPSYPDRAGFGRTEMDLGPEALFASVAAQVGRLAALARALGQAVRYVKPHGALYHAANRDGDLARAVVLASASALSSEFSFIGPPEGELRRAAAEAGRGYLREGFADRGVRGDGALIPRGEPGALVVDPARAAANARRLALSGAVDTVCVHGDTEDALTIARAAREALDALREA